MTIASTTSKISYNGAGTTGPFAIPFKFLVNADIIATHVSSAGVETTLTLTTQYTLSGAGVPSGGSLSLITALAVGEKLIIHRDPAITQEVDYVENAAFPAESHENALDKLTMIAQSNAEKLSRALLVDISSPVTPADLLTTLAADVASAAASAAAAAASAAAAAASAAGAAVGTAENLFSATTTINVSGAAAPTAGQKLTATDGTHATWVSDDTNITKGNVTQARTKPHYPASVELASNAGTLAFSLLTHESCYKKLASNASVTLGQPSDMAADLWLQVELEGTGTNTVAYHADYLKESLGALPTSIANGKHLTLCFRCTTRSGNLKMVYVGHTMEV